MVYDPYYDPTERGGRGARHDPELRRGGHGVARTDARGGHDPSARPTGWSRARLARWHERQREEQVARIEHVVEEPTWKSLSALRAKAARVVDEAVTALRLQEEKKRSAAKEESTRREAERSG